MENRENIIAQSFLHFILLFAVFSSLLYYTSILVIFLVCRHPITNHHFLLSHFFKQSNGHLLFEVIEQILSINGHRRALLEPTIALSTSKLE